MRDDEVQILEYDPGWASKFAEMAAPIAHALGPNFSRIDHIGSTAVAGLGAKPLIDINVGLSPRGSLDEAMLGPARLRFRAMNPESVLFAIYEDGIRVANVHVRRTGSEDERWDLLFRDFLRSHAAHVDAYIRAKRAAASRHPRDRALYSKEKSKYFGPVTAEIEAWAEQSAWSIPPPDVAPPP